MQTLPPVPRTSEGQRGLSGSSGRVTILFVIDSLQGAAGGTEQHLLFLLRELPRDRFHVHFAVLSAFGNCDSTEFPVPPAMPNGRPRSWLRPLRQVQWLRALISMLKPHIVQAMCPRSEADSLLAAKFSAQTTVLGVRRNTGYWHNQLTLWRARLLSRLGGTYVANCGAARDFAVRNEWIAQDRVTVIRNPVLRQRLEEGLASPPSRGDLGIAADEWVVGMVATIRPVKDHRTFLCSARLVLDRYPMTRFLLIGTEDPKCARELRALSRTLGIERQLTWVGPVKNPLHLLPLFDVAVLSSRSEGMSNALLEYAAAGIATVATDVGAAREIIDDEVCGFLVQPRSPEAMADRICRLLRDDTLRRQFGEKAQRKIRESFSEEEILGEYSRLYLRLAGR